MWGLPIRTAKQGQVTALVGSSSGERQRISIARAFLKDAPIILLDEATASLDVENETAIQKALSRLIRTKLFSSLPIGCAPFPARIRSWC